MKMRIFGFIISVLLSGCYESEYILGPNDDGISSDTDVEDAMTDDTHTESGSSACDTL
ncbi:MAG: hypothetical protein GY847_25440 [Proteobacteria bacterium]|nr:hypothetical protein [Pseudomonadota bacterium]